MKLLIGCLAAAVLAAGAYAQPGDPPVKTVVAGLQNPTGIAVGGDGRVYVSIEGMPGKQGDGAVVVLDKGKFVPFAVGFDDPAGVAAFQKWVFVADRGNVWRMDAKGKAEALIKAEAFPVPPRKLGDLVADPESGTLYVTDLGDDKGEGAAIYRVPPKGKPTVVTDKAKWPGLTRPSGLALDGASHLLTVDAGTGKLHRVRISDGKAEEIAAGFGSGGGIAWDRHGRLFVADRKAGKLLGINRPGAKPVVVAQGLGDWVDICLDPKGKAVLATDRKAGSLVSVAAAIPGFAVDETPLQLETVVAFPKLKWTDWSPENEKGVPMPLRPIVLTHAGDGSNRIFVATQHGVIHAFPDDPNADKTSVFLNIQHKVVYNDKQNEEGLLGLAFHPKYKENGEFFVLYTLKGAKHKNTNILSRFKVSKDNPNKADPATEEELLRIERPYWNHDGGTICFGPDGFLYIAVGDGGLGGDPHNNGQNLKTLLAKILRIDIDRKDSGLAYAIPKDNPFVGKEDARPETWAYGLRNVWRMAFDRKTGQLWAADVGQNLYEEINLIVKGGNYGWKLRESLHPFGPQGVGERKDLVDPIWEYHHSVGVSITGGNVYRGKRFPELEGAYIYGDYVKGTIWALRYDEKAGRVVSNRPITTYGQVIFSFGEDERGETYMLTPANNGQGIYQFRRKASTR